MCVSVYIHMYNYVHTNGFMRSTSPWAPNIGHIAPDDAAVACYGKHVHIVTIRNDHSCTPGGESTSERICM